MPLPCGCSIPPTGPPCSCAADAFETLLDALAETTRAAGRDAAHAEQRDRRTRHLAGVTPCEARQVARSSYVRTLAAAVVAAISDHTDVDEHVRAAVDGVAAGWADVFDA